MDSSISSVVSQLPEPEHQMIFREKSKTPEKMTVKKIPEKMTVKEILEKKIPARMTVKEIPAKTIRAKMTAKRMKLLPV